MNVRVNLGETRLKYVLRSGDEEIDRLLPVAATVEVDDLLEIYSDGEPNHLTPCSSGGGKTKEVLQEILQSRWKIVQPIAIEDKENVSPGKSSNSSSNSGSSGSSDEDSVTDMASAHKNNNVRSVDQ